MALLVFTAGTLCSQPLSGADGPNRLTDTNGPARRPIDEAYGTLPLIFEANRGQAAEPVRFLARGVGYRLLLSPTDAVLHMASAPQDPGASLRMRFSGADPRAAFIGLDEQPGKVNYFVGKDASRWRTGIPAYARVAVKSVYPGVDLVYYGNQHHLEYDFIIEPGADPRAINLAFEGASRVIVDGRGDVVLQVGEGAVRLRKPVAYQDIDGRRRPIDARFVQRTARQIALAVGRYDRRLPLIIDPELVYSTVFGGSRYNVGQAVAVDADGNAYVTGWTDTDFPVTNWIDGSSRGYGGDVFVTKFDPTGRALVFSTIVGGAAGQDQPRGIGVDAAGNVYVAGETMSYDFPTTPGAVQPTCSLGACPPAPSIGFQDGFAFKLDPTGSTLLYSTFLGGSGNDTLAGMAVDAAGHLFATGETLSADLPTVNAFQPRMARSNMATAFVLKLNANGSAFDYATYLGGTVAERGIAIAVDAAGNAYATGITVSSDFPTTPGAMTRPADPGDVFVTKFDVTGSSLIYSTVFGGSGWEEVHGIAVDRAGRAHVTGITASVDYPTVNAIASEAHDTVPIVTGAVGDAFVATLQTDGTRLLYSTYLGGTRPDSGTAIAVDSAGRIHVTGETHSIDFPVSADALDATCGTDGNCDVTNPLDTGGQYADAFFVVIDWLRGGPSSLVYGTYLGGKYEDFASAIAVDAGGNTYLAGSTNSPGFLESLRIGSQTAVFSAFLTKIDVGLAPALHGLSGIVYYSSTSLAGVAVELVSGSPTDPPLRSTVTDQNGRYGFQDVAPGSYHLKVYGPTAEYLSWEALSLEIGFTDVVLDFQLAKKMILTSPANGSTLSTLQPALTWQANPEAARYVIQINQTNTWNQIDAGATSTTTSYVVQTPLTPGEQYTWLVDAYDAANRNVGKTDSWVTFTVSTVTAPPEIEVTTLEDSGPGSLRAAIEASNARAGIDNIKFSVAGTIHLVSPLPGITDPVTMNAYGESLPPTIKGVVTPIQLDGSSAGDHADGLRIEAGGTTINGFAIAGFGGSAIRVDAGDNRIGNNRLAANAGAGVLVAAGNGTLITGNAILNNGGRGIDLAAGANGDEPSPMLLWAVSEGRITTVLARLAGAPGRQFTLEFFDNEACNPAAAGEGALYFGALEVTTDAVGVATAQFLTVFGAPLGHGITATATDTDSNTSQFSNCMEITSEPTADLSVAMTASPSPAVPGGAASYQATIANAGPSAALAASADISLPLNFGSASVTSTSGSCAVVASSVHCDFETILTGAQATVTVNGTVDPSATADLIATATIGSSATDPDGSNNSASATLALPVPPPLLSIDDVSVTEGDTGTTPATFTVTLSKPSDKTVSVSYKTVPLSATEGIDYVAAQGTLFFSPGTTTRSITVDVRGDNLVEADQTFGVQLSAAVNADISDGLGIGTIVENDRAELSINNVTVVEGNSGATAALFTVTLSKGSTTTITVNFATADDTAHAGSDYVAASGTLTFSPHTLSRTVSIAVTGDVASELDEQFFVNLSSATNALISDGRGIGTIRNDDRWPILVTTVNDSGSGSLRAALTAANSGPGGDAIWFAIPGSGPYVIEPLTRLPVLTAAGVTIDGWTQPGYADTPLIEISGAHMVPNTATGLDIRTDQTLVRGLVINGFGTVASGTSAVALTGNENRVEGNYLGTDRTGTLARANGTAVEIRAGAGNHIGGLDPAARNVISGNGYGVLIQYSVGGTTDTVIEGNYVGTDPTGQARVSGSQTGIRDQGGIGTRIQANLISGQEQTGIELVSSDGALITGNTIGTTATQSAALMNAASQFDGAAIDVQAGAHQTVIGGLTSGAGNVIAGNDRLPSGFSMVVICGVRIASTFSAPSGDTLVQGNWIGLTPAGRPLPNTIGVCLTDTTGTVIGGSVAAARNVIAGNRRHGLELAGADRVHVIGNAIGLALGATAVGNGESGIEITSNSFDNVIGGVDPGEGNVITANAVGVRVVNGQGTAIRGNSIVGNTRLGIDLLSVNGGFAIEGVTPNDPGDGDTGANALQNYPVLQSARASVVASRMIGTLDGAANASFQLDFFATASCDASGYGEGEAFIGTATVATSALGIASFDVLLSPVAPGLILTATATDANGSTSEFSQCGTVVADATVGVNTPVGTNVTPRTDDTRLTVTFANVTSPGMTTITPITSGPVPPDGFRIGNSTLVFDITTTAIYSGPVTVCLSYAGVTITNPSSLSLFHYEGGRWVNVTVSNNTSTKIICGRVSSLSPFGIFERDNQSPLANAGPDRTLDATSDAGAVVTLDGSQSSDPDGDLLTFTWSGPFGTLTGPVVATAFPIGTSTVTLTVDDGREGIAQDALTIVVEDVTRPGEMHGAGFIVEQGDRYLFEFLVKETEQIGERGQFRLRLDHRKRFEKDKSGRSIERKPQDDTFVASAITFIAFSDDPTYRPGRPRKPMVDTVLFSGSGEWNGLPGYRFEVTASDEGEPGRHREAVAITIRDAAGRVVVSVNGDLDGGNVQSRRIQQ